MVACAQSSELANHNHPLTSGTQRRSTTSSGQSARKGAGPYLNGAGRSCFALSKNSATMQAFCPHTACSHLRMVIVSGVTITAANAPSLEQGTGGVPSHQCRAPAHT